VTLIDYLNRVHFAENILEDAVWAELDQRHGSVVCLLCDSENREAELGERMRAGVPRHMRIEEFRANGAVPTETDARSVAKFYHENSCTLLVAYGRGATINLAKAARLVISHNAPLGRFSQAEGGALRISNALPDLIAVPSLNGFSAGFNGFLSIQLDDGSMAEISSRHLVPSVTIGDPTVAASANTRDLTRAGINAVTICTEAIISPSYNPPANGIALDGLNRGLHFLRSRLPNPSGEERRELLAACMDAAMVQQTGLGLSHAITTSFCVVTRLRIDKGDLKRLLLPKILAGIADHTPTALVPLANALGVASPRNVIESFENAFQVGSMTAGLSELGVTSDQLAETAERAARHRALANSPGHISAAEILKILLAIY